MVTPLGEACVLYRAAFYGNLDRRVIRWIPCGRCEAPEMALRVIPKNEWLAEAMNPVREKDRKRCDSSTASIIKGNAREVQGRSGGGGEARTSDSLLQD